MSSQTSGATAEKIGPTRDGAVRLEEFHGGLARLASKRALRSYIESALERGLLEAGDRLPTERAFADASGLSRTSVRDILAALEVSGHVVRRVGAGTFVKPPPQCAGPQSVAEVTPATLMEFRVAVEPALAQLVVMKASDEELERIRGFVQRSRGADTWEACEHADSEFHSLVLRAARNELAERLGEQIARVRGERAWRRLKERSFSLDRWRIYQAQHEAIAEALCARDAHRVSAAVRRHLTGVSAVFLG